MCASFDSYLLRGGCRFRTTECENLARKLFHIKWFRNDELDDTGVELCQRLMRNRGDDGHRRVDVVLPHEIDDLESVHLGDHEVEDEDVVNAVANSLDRLLPVVRDVDIDAAPLQQLS